MRNAFFFYCWLFQKSKCLLESIRDEAAEGAEALAVAFEGNLKGHAAVEEVVEEVTPAGGVGLRISPSGCRHGRASISPPNDP